MINQVPVFCFNNIKKGLKLIKELLIAKLTEKKIIKLQEMNEDICMLWVITLDFFMWKTLIKGNFDEKNGSKQWNVREVNYFVLVND